MRFRCPECNKIISLNTNICPQYEDSIMKTQTTSGLLAAIILGLLICGAVAWTYKDTIQGIDSVTKTYRQLTTTGLRNYSSWGK